MSAAALEPTYIREAFVRYRGGRRKVPHPIVQPDNLASFVRAVVDHDPREHFVVVMVDARHRPIGYQTVSIGTVNASLVHPREVFQAAVGVGAVALLVAHNHPSGDTSPSREDRDITERLTKAGEVLGIRVLDSLVVSETGWHSMKTEVSS